VVKQITLRHDVHDIVLNLKIFVVFYLLVFLSLYVRTAVHVYCTKLLIWSFWGRKLIISEKIKYQVTPDPWITRIKVQLIDRLVHTGLTRVSSIRFLLFEIKRVLVYNSIIIYFTDLFVLYFFIQNAYADKKVFKSKGWQITFNGSNCDRKSQLSGILTETLNPRG